MSEGLFVAFKNHPSYDGKDTGFVIHDFPNHIIYRPRFKDHYMSTLTESAKTLLVRTGTASNDIKWFKKRFPKMSIEKDMGYGIWFWKSNTTWSDRAKETLFDEENIGLRAKLYEALIEKYGTPSSAKYFAV